MTTIPLPARDYDRLLRADHAGLLAATGVDLNHAHAVYLVFLSASIDVFEAWRLLVGQLFERETGMLYAPRWEGE